MNATLTASQGPERDHKPGTSMKSPLVASLVFHGFLILLFSGAFFFFSKPIEIPSEPMSVEILPVTETASSLTEAPIAKKIKEPEEITEEPPPMAKVTEQKIAPKAEEPKPKTETREKLEEPKPAETPKPIKKAEVAEKKAPPVPAKAPEKKPAAEKKEDVKEEPKPEKEAAEFSSVLKNLVGEEDAQPVPDSVPRDTPRQAPQLTAPAPLGSQLSMSEMDALRAQLAQCWNVIAGARDAQDLAVDIEVNVAMNKTVISARIVDQLRYSADHLFRAAADSAMRALKSPGCTPLALPDNKYEQWKNMTVQFDPKNMF